MEFISSNIKFLRKQKRLTTKILANAVRVKEHSILELEKNPTAAPLSLILSISSFFSVSLDTLVHVNLDIKKKKSSNIKFLVLDVDGVLTDAGMYYAESGNEFKKFNSKDGLAIKHLIKSGIEVAFLSNGKNTKLIQARAKLLGVKRVYVGLDEKILILDKWLKELKINYKNVAYLGDDVNDLQAIKKAGLSACPADANEVIRKKAHIVLHRNGGDACVREFIDRYLSLT